MTSPRDRRAAAGRRRTPGGVYGRIDGFGDRVDSGSAQGRESIPMAASVDRSVVLVTGMSGTGKSTVLAELGRRGHRVVDTDEPGWIVSVPVSGAAEAEPMWDLARLGRLLDEHREGWLFVAGCVANQGALYARFDAVVLLSAPLEVILARVAERANPFGSSSSDRAKIASDLTEFEPRLRAGADHEIRATGSVAEVVAAVERVAAGAGAR